MNRLEPEITTIKNRLQEIEWCLILSNERNDEVVRNQEQVEHRLNNLEDLYEELEKKVTMLQEDVGLIHEYLNGTITRVNDLHRCLDEWTDKDLRCDEKLTVNDDDDNDDEFDLSDYDEKLDLEVAKTQQMEDNACMNE